MYLVKSGLEKVIIKFLRCFVKILLRLNKMEKKKKSALKSTLKKALKNKIVLITGGTGSILDKDRLDTACDGVDIIIHAAAIKNIEIS